MAGIYIHIPFCKKACHYCNFHFSTSQKQSRQMIEAIVSEASLQKDYLHETVSTLYFGGGTPSILEADDIKLIMEKLYDNFFIDADIEITLEANPDDIDEKKLSAWKALGINRLSIGVQSFFDEDLQWMNRAHNAAQSIHCIQLAQDKGFSNISIDLIYGVPGLSDDRWKANVDTSISLNIPHLSCYALTVEPATALDKMIKLHKKENTDSEAQSRQFKQLMQWLRAAGYMHYEISNFAKPGMQSKHNSSYWQGKSYLGLGPSAHSFNGESRQWNISNNSLYIKKIEGGEVPFEQEQLTSNQKQNEYIMTSLRTTEGISLHYLKEKFGHTSYERVMNLSSVYIKQELMIADKDHLILTDEGKLFADGIAADFFV